MNLRTSPAEAMRAAAHTRAVPLQRPAGASPGRSQPAGTSARPARFMTVDHGLGIAGLACAFASCAFAAVMIAHNTGPDVARSGYFSVFAQLRDKTVGRRQPTLAATPGDDVDPIVTGSIQPRAEAAVAAPTRQTLEGFSLQEVFGSTALVDSPTGLQVVRRGSTLLGAGPVLAIARDGTRVVLTTPKGVIWRDAE